MAGYSGTPLPQKLGIRSGHRVVVLGAPGGFALALPAGARQSTRLVAGTDIVLLFVRSRVELPRKFGTAKAKLAPAGGLWVAWPKKASGVPTDLTEDVIRAHALDAGLVDNKVCAIDEIWSGLRCVFRLADRPRG